MPSLYCLAMRSGLAFLLCLLLLSQGAWAAVARYCAHEQGRPVSHLGHHEHQHGEGASDLGGTADPDAGPDGAAAQDHDGHCHLQAPVLATASPPALQHVRPPAPAEPATPARQAPWAHAIERPQWAAA